MDAPSGAPARRGCFVTGTDTGAGKTVLAAAIAAALSAAGERVAAYKPVVTGLEDPEPGVAADHELLAWITGQRAEAVAPARFGPPLSPHFAARLDGVTLDPASILAGAHAAAASADALIVEGVGGLLVPLTEDWLVRDFARALALPLVIAARPGLGTINHTLLTLEAARAADLEVRAVVLTPWPHDAHASTPGIERSNRETLARLGEVEVAVLAQLPALDRAALASAGAALAAQRWLISDRVAV